MSDVNETLVSVSRLQQVMDRFTEEEKVMTEWRERVRRVRYGLTVAENAVDTQFNDAVLTKAQLDDRLSAMQVRLVVNPTFVLIILWNS